MVCFVLAFGAFGSFSSLRRGRRKKNPFQSGEKPDLVHAYPLATSWEKRCIVEKTGTTIVKTRGARATGDVATSGPKGRKCWSWFFCRAALPCLYYRVLRYCSCMSKMSDPPEKPAGRPCRPVRELHIPLPLVSLLRKPYRGIVIACIAFCRAGGRATVK